MHSEPMNARQYWDSYVERIGGLAAVATRLRTPYSTIAGITNGSRGIGHSLAARFAKADKSLDVNTLLWVRPIKHNS